MEIWKQIRGFGYEVSTWGRIKNTYTGQILKPYTNHKGYLKIELYRKGRGYKKRIHRLVAEAFIPNPYGYPQVDHIDGNKQNNSITNLRWVDNKMNCEHAKELRLNNTNCLCRPEIR